MDLRLVALHVRDDLRQDAVRLLNSQWTRSPSARLVSLSRSSDDLPCCLVLVANDSNVVGYGRLSAVVGHVGAVLIESVVVEASLRGQGLGRKLMDCCESYARNLGYDLMFLSTHDKEGFYAHLGYSRCQPVSGKPAGGLGIADTRLSRLATCFGGSRLPVTEQEEDGQTHAENCRVIDKDDDGKASAVTSAFDPNPPPPGPPPPPPPPALASALTSRERKEEIVWMKKYLKYN